MRPEILLIYRALSWSYTRSSALRGSALYVPFRNRAQLMTTDKRLSSQRGGALLHTSLYGLKHRYAHIYWMKTMAKHMEGERKKDAGKRKDAREEVMKNVWVFLPGTTGAVKNDLFVFIVFRTMWGWWILELELQTIVSCHVVAGNRTSVLWKSSHLNCWAIPPAPPLPLRLKQQSTNWIPKSRGDPRSEAGSKG